MVAKLGHKNIHHFAHKSGDESCFSETYLHKLGKLLSRNKFKNLQRFK